MARLIQGDQHRDDEERRVDSNGAHGASGNGDSGEDGAASPRGVSIAYAGGGRQPVLHNLAGLFQLGRQSLRESLGAADDDDERKGKDSVACHGVLPVVRLMAVLFFPLFLLSFFLLHDIGRALTRSVRLRHGLFSLRPGDAAVVVHPVVRRKTVHEFPGHKRELLFIPLERTVNVAVGDDEDEDEGSTTTTSFEATMPCPRAVLFLFHGCSRYAASFFYSPQGRLLVSAAHRKGIAVVAFQKDDERGCWDWDADGEVVLRVGRKFATRLGGTCGKGPDGEDAYPPMWAFGASSGGSFVAMLAARMEEEPETYAPFVFSALNVQIMDPPEGLDWNTPTAFTVMAGDVQTKERVQARVARKFQGGPFKLIATSGRKRIRADHFERLFADDRQMTPEVSRDIHRSLVTMGIVDGATDRLLANPRREADAVASVWEAHGMESRGGTWSRRGGGALPYGMSDLTARPLRPHEIEDADSIWLIEELNVAFDQHEITAEGFDEVLAFFDEFGVPR